MKLDYLADGSPDSPLIRLYDFTAAEAGQLLAAVHALASGAAQRIDVHTLPFVEALGGCRLALVPRPWDQAILRTPSPSEFACGFTANTWHAVADLVEPFAAGARGFQWLAGTPGQAALLLSASATGQW